MKFAQFLILRKRVFAQNTYVRFVKMLTFMMKVSIIVDESFTLSTIDIRNL